MFQIAIFNFIETMTGHCMVNACAGSGKTTTLIEIMKRATGKIIFLAFNKAIADHLKSKAPSNVNCSTLHSAGYSIIRSTIGKVNVDNYKIDKIMDTYIPLTVQQYMKQDEKTAIYNDRKVVKGLVALVKNNMIDYTSADQLADAADHYGIEYDSKYLPYVKYIIETNNSKTSTIDFDDMIYLPVVLKMKNKNKYDFVLVDEAQDLNKCQIELVLSLVNKNGRIVCVGDPKQSIYGFRGADTSAMSRMQTILDATELPLSVCYRCPTSHLDMARNIVPQIEARDNAPTGIIETINAKNFIDKVTKENNPLILSRTNAYMVGFALQMIAKGFKAVIKGRDFGAGLISLVKKLSKGNADLYAMIDSLTEWKTVEYKKLDSRKAAQSAYDIIDDKVDTIIAVSEDCKNVQCIVDKLDKLFNDDSAASFIFSSVHRAKGLEADTVYNLTPHLMPLIRKDQKDWELDQEYNIKYVALTRAKNKMVFVNPAK